MKARKLLHSILSVIFALSLAQPQSARADEAARTVELIALDGYNRPTGSVLVSAGSDNMVRFQVCPLNQECANGGAIAKDDLIPLLKELKNEAELKRNIKTFGALAIAVSISLFGLFTGHDVLAALGFFPMATLCVKAAGSPNATERCSTSVEGSLEIIADVKNVKPGKTRKLKMHADIGEFARFLKKAQAR